MWLGRLQENSKDAFSLYDILHKKKSSIHINGESKLYPPRFTQTILSKFNEVKVASKSSIASENVCNRKDAQNIDVLSLVVHDVTGLIARMAKVSSFDWSPCGLHVLKS